LCHFNIDKLLLAVNQINKFLKVGRKEKWLLSENSKDQENFSFIFVGGDTTNFIGGRFGTVHVVVLYFHSPR
jgi:hypothetical protein